MNKSRSSRRQRGIPISIDGDNDGILSCLTRGFPDVLRCGPCKAKFDPIGFGRGNKNNILSSSCCQLWIAGPPTAGDGYNAVAGGDDSCAIVFFR